jgi:SAM-dependent methyltransferase
MQTNTHLLLSKMQHEDLEKRQRDSLEKEETKKVLIIGTVSCVTKSREGPSPSFIAVPNSQLSEEEKEAKRRLKKRLRMQVKVDSLQNSIRHARRRKDATTENIQQNKLDDLLEKEHEIIQEMQFGSDSSSNSYSLNNLKEKAKPFVEEVSKALVYSQAAKNALGEGISKESQISNAVKLLKHMTRGTQELSMFQDEAALWGYTRQKFYERALLLCASLGRIQLPCQEHVMGSSLDPKLREQQQLRQQIWCMLTSNKVRKVCSIGCGPGNDLVGMLSFLRLHHNDEGDDVNILDKVLLMDWSIDEWKAAIIGPLNDILKQKGFLNDIDTVFCDITKDFNDDGNKDALQQNPFDFDLFSISYLLSETRGKWGPFLKALVSNAKPGAMFYFAEPVPWQLHRFVEFFTQELQFIWLDSSMDYPIFQKADRRAGPSVLFAIKKEVKQK